MTSTSIRVEHARPNAPPKGDRTDPAPQTATPTDPTRPEGHVEPDGTSVGRRGGPVSVNRALAQSFFDSERTTSHFPPRFDQTSR